MDLYSPWGHKESGMTELLSLSFSHPYMTTGKTMALTIQTFVSKVMPLLLNTLSRFAIAVLTRSKHLLVSYTHTHARVHTQTHGASIVAQW